MFARVKSLVLGLVCAVLAITASAVPSEAAVTNLFTEAAVITAFEGWTASVGTVIAVAVGVAFATMAVFGAMAMIRRIGTRGVR